jgi:hypothetical protein
MTQKRYAVDCRQCGPIEADTASDGLFTKATAHRRAGYHEGAFDHECEVRVETETPEYRCPICHTLCTGKRERDEHARTEPGVKPDSFPRV